MSFSLESLVPKAASVRLLNHELEDLDYHLLYPAYSAKGRNPAVDPKTMFKILILLTPSASIPQEKLKLPANGIDKLHVPPGRKESTDFLAEACEDLFDQLVLRFAVMGELYRESVFIDGTKRESGAHKDTFAWRRSVGNWGKTRCLRT